MNIKEILYKATFFPRVVKQFYYKNYNKMLFSLANVKYGINLNVSTKMILKKYKGAQMIIGDNFHFTSGDTINPISRNISGCIVVNHNGVLKIGNNVGISSACIWVNKGIIIEDNVKIGGDSIILDTDCHSLNYEFRRDSFNDRAHTQNSQVIIEKDVLIGARCIILKGVHIGARSIVGAGSVVSKDIPSDCIAVGNPCKIIKIKGNENTAN